MYYTQSHRRKEKSRNIGSNERRNFCLCIVFQFLPPESRQCRGAYGMAASATNSLLWQYLSVLVTFSLPSLFIEPAGRGASKRRRGEDWKERREEEGREGKEGEGDFIPWSLPRARLPPQPMRRRGGRGRALAKPTAITGMVKLASLAHQMDGMDRWLNRMGWIYPETRPDRANTLTD